MAATFSSATAQNMVVPVTGAIVQGSTRSEELESPMVVSEGGVTTVVGCKKYKKISGSVQVKGPAGLALAVAATGASGQMLVVGIEQDESVEDFPSGTIALSGYENLAAS